MLQRRPGQDSAHEAEVTVKPECLNCDRLGKCKVVMEDPQLILNHHVCVEWKRHESSEGVFARMRAVDLFGFQAAETLAKPDKTSPPE